MKNVYKQKREQGFTIIEVLIVLAIAALIFLIVFLAVPALNRSSRNNAIKHDAADLISGIQTFESNNNGQLPTAVDCTTAPGTATVKGAAGTQSNDIGIQATDVCNFNAGVITTGTANLGHLHIDTGNSCNANNNGYSANVRSVAISYLVETGAGATSQAVQCVSS